VFDFEQRNTGSEQGFFISLGPMNFRWKPFGLPPERLSGKDKTWNVRDVRMIGTYWASLRNSGEEDILLADCTAASFTESVTIST